MQNYHVMQRGKGGSAIFFETSDHKIYLRILRENLRRTDIKILAYCLMPNHVHLVIRAENDQAVAHFFKLAHGNFAKFIQLKECRSGALWTGRYVCAISENYLPRVIRYIELNPVRSQIAARPETFAWSSAPVHFGNADEAGVLDLDYWRGLGGAKSWKAMLAEVGDDTDAETLRACTFGRQPFGEPDYLQRAAFEKKLKREAAA